MKSATEFFPEPLRSFIKASASALACDEAYIAVTLLPVTASAIGNTRRIRLKGSWTEPAVVWTAIVGESGTVKSPALELATRPVWRRQQELLRDYAKAHAQYESDKEEWKGAAKDERGDQPTAPPPPEHPICSDITVEALVDRLQATPRGTLVALDELSAWLMGFNQYKAGGSDVAHWLSMFGARALKVDRKTGERTTIFVPHAAVSVTGTIQPATLRRALLPEFFENGLAARLLVVEPPTRPKQWTEQEVPDELFREVDQVFEHLYAMQHALGPAGDHGPVMVDLLEEARADFATFVNQWNKDLQELSGAARAAWAKLEGYAARFALIRHCIRQATGEKASEYVDGEDMAAGIELAKWFAEETLRAYRLMRESDDDRRRRDLRRWIAAKGRRVTLRDVAHGPRQYRDTPGLAEADLRALAKAGYGSWKRSKPGPRGGKPTEVFVLADSPEFPLSKPGAGTVTEGSSGKSMGIGAGAALAEAPKEGA